MKRSTWALALALAVAPLSASALTPQQEYDMYKRFIRTKSANQDMNFAQEVAAIDYAYNVYITQIDHPWTWWFYTDDFAKPVAPGTINYNAILSGSQPITLQSTAFSAGGISLGVLPAELVAAGFAGVRYDVEYGDGAWQTIGTSTDAAHGYSISATITGFEPLFKATAVDGAGASIMVLDTAGNDMASAEVLAVAVPEPGQWMLLVAGLGVLGGMSRRTRRGLAPAGR